MSMVIELSQDVEKRLREQAANTGQRPEDLARQFVESSVMMPSLDEDFARFRKAILASGESEEESAQFFQSVVDDVRSDRLPSNQCGNERSRG
jgi:predicted transcriptional regulator